MGHLSAAGSYKPSFQNFRSFACPSQTRRFEVWPDLTAAIRHGQAVSLGEDRHFGSLNLRSKSWYGDHRGSEQRHGRQGEEGFEHWGLLTGGLWPRRFRGLP